MSNEKKDWKIRHLQLDRKEQRPVYLTEDHWHWLKEKGNGSATHAIRDMIESSRGTKADHKT